MCPGSPGTMADPPQGNVKVVGSPWENSLRLPTSVHPDHYDLYLCPNLSTKAFSGRVTIHITSSETRNYFLVHTKWLSITQTQVVRVKGKQMQDVPIIEVFEYKPNEFWVIRTDDVEPGRFQITTTYTGSLQKGILGFYYSEYTDAEGNSRGLATTKFEPTYARRAFPCLDEPSFKSTYNITIVRPSEGYIALSNMPVMKESLGAPSEGLTEVTFKKSVPMVTYLVCFIVCDFTFKEKILGSGMPFRVYAPSDRIENTQYALDTGASILQMYERMFDMPFPLPKSDMAAIPDYSSGATEHWGIITYRETSIFYNEMQSSAANLQRVTAVISHELAHQWFGNLVTLEWWNDLWLNEGFASYVEYKGVDYMYPDWDMDAQFLLKSLQVVMEIDACLSSHPIVKLVTTTDQINAMFDAISYKKGSSVLRMLENFMGEPAFQKGINSFLKKYCYGNAVTQDLWKELTCAWTGCVPHNCKNDVGEIMDTWTRQMGYPVVNVVRTSCEEVTLTQKRFLQDPAAQYDPSESEFGYKWDIPISYITSLDVRAQQAWLYREADNLKLKIDPEVLWVKVNTQQKGYYRVNYETHMWNELAKLCLDKVVGTAERAGLYNDIFALADAALVDYSVALDFSRGLASETDYVPWDSVINHLITMERLLAETDVYQPFCHYVLDLVKPIYTALGWTDAGDHLQKLLRIDVVSLACASGDKLCLKEAATELQRWIVDAQYSLAPGTCRQVYRWGIVDAGTEENWEVVWQRALVEQSATQLDNLYYGLANVQDTTILQRYIELAQDMKNVRSQNFLHVLQYISSNPAGTDLVWDWVRSNWKWLVDRYSLNDRYLGQLIPCISKYFSTAEKLSQMKEFFGTYPEAGAGELNRAQALETVHFNIRWVDAYSAIIHNWLKSQK
nr:glutamyl aminopeptidase-like isoform X1 [Procambarus clarkii]